MKKLTVNRYALEISLIQITLVYFEVLDWFIGEAT
jgi:hypothetical protein